MSQQKKQVQFYTRTTPQAIEFGLDGQIPVVLHTTMIPQTLDEICSASEKLGEFTTMMNSAKHCSNNTYLSGASYSITITYDYNFGSGSYKYKIEFPANDYKHSSELSGGLNVDNTTEKMQQYAGTLRAVISEAKHKLLPAETPKPTYNNSKFVVTTKDCFVEMRLIGEVDVLLVSELVGKDAKELDDMLELIGALSSQIDTFKKDKQTVFRIRDELSVFFEENVIGGISYNAYMIVSDNYDSGVELRVNITREEFAVAVQNYIYQIRAVINNLRAATKQ